MPAPMSTIANMTRLYPESTVDVDATARPDANSSMPVTTTRFVPNHCTALDDSGAMTISANANGSVRSPASNALYPSTNCRYCVARKMKPNRAKNTSVTFTLAAVNRGLAKNRTSSIGSSMRRSHHTNVISESAATAKPARIRGLGPAVARGLDDGGDQRAQPDDRQARADEVELRAASGCATSGRGSVPRRSRRSRSAR